MTVPVIRGFLIACAISAWITLLSGAQEKKSKKLAPVPTSGEDLYKRNCAVCHGNDGKGNGPPAANSVYKEPPPDLTTLARRHGGEFPEPYVVDVLRSGVKMPANGLAEMPVWGMIFNAMSKGDEKQVQLRIMDLTNYLRSIQAK